MQCFIYRSPKKSNTYLYVLKKNEFSDVPQGLMKLFGKPEFALELELTPERKLAAADALEVLKNLSEQGFHLQMPAVNEFPI
jgi:uncharacterized protein